MTDLSDLVPAYKREVAVPGEFAQTFPSTTDNDILGALGDGFAQCQLDGFFGAYELDVDTGETDPDLSLAGAALVVFYSGTNAIRARIRELRHTRYVAGPTAAEVEPLISALVEELKSLERRKEQFLENALSQDRAATTYVIDSYPTRGVLYGGFFGGELPSGWC